MNARAQERFAETTFAILASIAPVSIALLLGFLIKESAPLLWIDSADATFDPSDLLEPRMWRGYEIPAFVWQPIGITPKYNLAPLLLGTLKITFMTLFWSVPIGVGSAIYISQYAPPKLRAVAKPLMEFLAGVPSVVFGFFALTTLGTWVSAAFGCAYRLNALTASLAMSLAVIPIVFSLSEEALRAVPRHLTDAALSLGARRSQVVFFVVAPAARPGIVAAVLLGFGRATGETMIALMASGNAPTLSGSLCASARTVTATLASELGETAEGTIHWRVLFLLGALLFSMTVVIGRISRALAASIRMRFSAPYNIGGEP